MDKVGRKSYRSRKDALTPNSSALPVKLEKRSLEDTEDARPPKHPRRQEDDEEESTDDEGDIDDDGHMNSVCFLARGLSLKYSTDDAGYGKLYRVPVQTPDKPQEPTQSMPPAYSTPKPNKPTSSRSESLSHPLPSRPPAPTVCQPTAVASDPHSVPPSHSALDEQTPIDSTDINSNQHRKHTPPVLTTSPLKDPSALAEEIPGHHECSQADAEPRAVSRENAQVPGSQTSNIAKLSSTDGLTLTQFIEGTSRLVARIAEIGCQRLEAGDHSPALQAKVNEWESKLVSQGKEIEVVRNTLETLQREREKDREKISLFEEFLRRLREGLVGIRDLAG